MAHEPRPFRRFLDRMEAETMVEDLRGKGLDATFHDNSSEQDPLFTGAALPSFHVLLPPEEFVRAERFLEQQVMETVDEVPVDHHLHGSGDQELMDLLLHPDEWDTGDVVLAKRILRERGMEIPDAMLAALREARLRDMRAPAPPQTPFIVLGYFSALLGGLLAIFIGWYLNTAKKTLPNGERVYAYRSADRRHGLWLVVIGAVVALGYLVFRIVLILDR